MNYNYTFRQMLLLLGRVTAVLGIFCSVFISAQTLTLSTFASGLNGPIGITADSNGNLWVAEVGTGNDDGEISILTPNGNKYPFMVGLPSFYEEETGEVIGPWHVYLLPGNMVALVIGGQAGTDFGASVAWTSSAGFLPGDAPFTTSDITYVDHIGDYVYSIGYDDSNPYAAEWDSNGNMYVADAGANAIVRVDAITGNYSIFATFPDFPNPIPVGPPFVNVVPTNILATSDGSGFYVSSLTGFPFTPGTASIFHVDWDGNVTTMYAGLSTITGMAINPINGNLMVTQLGEFSLDIFDFLPNSSQVLEITPDGVVTPVVGLLNSLTGIAYIGPDLYLSSVFMGEIYALKEQETLPVTLSAFNGKAQESGNLLQWTTASETNCATFTLQYAPDAQHFTTLATLNGAGTSSVSRHYNFTHLTPAKGNNYYRLIQTDYDGQSTILGTINVQRSQIATHLQVAVQDSHLYAFFADNTVNEPATARIYDLGGRLLNQQILNPGNTGIVALEVPANLQKGMYVLQINTTATMLSTKFVW